MWREEALGLLLDGSDFITYLTKTKVKSKRQCCQSERKNREAPLTRFCHLLHMVILD